MIDDRLEDALDAADLLTEEAQKERGLRRTWVTIKGLEIGDTLGIFWLNPDGTLETIVATRTTAKVHQQMVMPDGREMTVRVRNSREHPIHPFSTVFPVDEADVDVQVRAIRVDDKLYGVDHE
jgi:hypothetical protein